MNSVMRPAFTTFLLALLHFHGSTSLNEIRTCQVIRMSPTLSDAQKNKVFITFDSIHLSSTAVYDTGREGETKQESSHVTRENTSKNNDTEDENIAQTVTPVPGEESTNCMCQVDSKTSTKISVKQAPSMLSKPVVLHIRESYLTEEKYVSEDQAWDQTFNDTTVELFVASANCTQSYRVILEVEGNFTNVSCTQPRTIAVIGRTLPDDGGRTQALQTNSELLFETPLLFIGGVMAVVGFLFIATGVVLWRRYRKTLQKLRKRNEKIKLKEIALSNYDVIANNDCVDDGSTLSDIETQCSSRKASMFSISKNKHKQENTSSSAQQFLAVIESPGKDEGSQKTSPSTLRFMRMQFGRQKKKQEHTMSKEKADNNNKVDNNEDETYSSVMLEEEDIPHQKLHSPCRGVATPFLIALGSGPQSPLLKKSENLSQAQIKARTMPKLRVSCQKNAYSHLNSTTKSHSIILDRPENYDSVDIYSSADDTVPCKTPNTARNGVDVFNFPKLKHEEIKVSTVKTTSDDEKSTSANGNQEHDHIYEAVEKVEIQSVFVKQRSGETNGEMNSRDEDSVKKEKCGNRETIVGIRSQSVVIRNNNENVAENEHSGTKSINSHDDATNSLDTAVSRRFVVDKTEAQNIEENRTETLRKLSFKKRRQSELLSERKKQHQVKEKRRHSSSVGEERRLLEDNGTVIKNILMNSDGKMSKNLQNNSNEGQCILKNSAEPPATIGYYNSDDSMSDSSHAQSDLALGGSEVKDSSRSDKENEQEGAQKNYVSDCQEVYVIVDNIVYESSDNLLHSSPQSKVQL